MDTCYMVISIRAVCQGTFIYSEVKPSIMNMFVLTSTFLLKLHNVNELLKNTQDTGITLTCIYNWKKQQFASCIHKCVDIQNG